MHLITRIKNASTNSKTAYLLSAAVLVVTLFFSLLVSINSVIVNESIQSQEFEILALDLEQAIEARMLAYEQVLHGTKGLLVSSGEVTRQEFSTYFKALNIDEHYPGMLGLGFAVQLAPESLSAHIDSVQQEGFPLYTVRPAGERDLYTSIVFLEPFSGVNLNAFGFDMYSETVRREAMQRSARIGGAALSGRVSLVQDVNRGGVSGTLLYLPVYNNEIDSSTSEDEVYGWVYSPFSMDILMQGLNFSNFDLLKVNIFDGLEANEQNILFAINSAIESASEPRFNYRKTLNIAGRAWTLDVNSTRAFEQNAAAFEPLIYIVSGVVISFLLTALVWSLVTSKERANLRAEEITEELRTTEYRWSAALASAGDGVWDWNFKSRQFVFSEHTKTMLKYSPDELGDSIEDWLKIVHSDDIDDALAAMNTLALDSDLHFRHEFRVRTGDGDWSWILMRGAAVEKDQDGKSIRAIGTFADVTDRKEIEDQHEFHALHDELTGLPNRRLVGQRLELLRKQAIESSKPLALMFIDLDHFKQVNDTYGHDVGDFVLCETSTRLSGLLRLTDVVGRFGGDEFVTLLPDINSVDDVIHVAENMKAAFSLPLVFEAVQVQATLSIGIVLFNPESRDGVAELLKKADTALYEAKSAGRNGYKVFEESMLS